MNDVISALLQSEKNLNNETVERLLEKLHTKIDNLSHDLNDELISSSLYDSLSVSLSASKAKDQEIEQVLENFDQQADLLELQLLQKQDNVEKKVAQLNDDLSYVENNLPWLSQFQILNENYSFLINESGSLQDQAQWCQASLNALENMIDSKQTFRLDKLSSGQLTVDEASLFMLKDEFISQAEKLKQTLNIEWRQMIQCEKGCETLTFCNKLSLHLIRNEEKLKFQQICLALYILGDLEHRVKNLATFFCIYIVDVLVEKKLPASIDNTKNGWFTISDSANPNICSPFEIIDNLETVFTILSQCLNIEIDTSKSTNDKKACFNFKVLFGKFVCQCTMDILKNRLLKSSIDEIDETIDLFDQKNDANKNRVETLVEKCNKFGQKLAEMGFSGLDHEWKIVNFMNEFDGLFLEAKCRWILSKARRLIQAKDMHEMVDYKSPENEAFGSDILKDWIKMAKHKNEDADDPKLSLSNMFIFPSCKISQSILYLDKLIWDTVQSAGKESDLKISLALFDSCIKCFELFVALYLEAHEDQWSQIPLIAALIHNNWMFMAYQAMKLTFCKLSEVYSKNDDNSNQKINVAFSTYVPLLRKMACDCAGKSLESSKAILINAIRSTDLSNLDDERRRKNDERLLKQALMQLQSLGRTWKEITTQSIVFEWQGELCKSILAGLCSKITCMEDITASDGKHIQDMLTWLLTNVDQLFKIDNQPVSHRFCGDEYLKFKEILFVLDASLQQIEDRWCNGQGPLALWLEKSELKQMIRALFQNTEKRAHLLAKIC